MTGEQLKFGFGRGLDRSRIAAAAGENFFVALQPNKQAEDQATGIARDFQRRLGVSEAIRPLHVTMDSLGHYRTFPTQLILEKKEALSNVHFEPFVLTFDEVTSYKRKDEKWPLVLCCSHQNTMLFDLDAMIAEAQLPAGMKLTSARAFTPHMTLFYSRKRIASHPLDVPVQWMVRDFCIIRSLHGETKHERLWSWPPLEQ